MDAAEPAAGLPEDSDSWTQDPLRRIWQELSGLGLEPYVADLEAHGFTVIPPAIASPNGLADRLLAAVLDVSEQRRGVRPDLATGATHAEFAGRYAKDGGDSPWGDLLHSLIFEGEAFEEALMNPVLLAMTTYLCGYSVVLSSMGAFLKGPNKTQFGLHCDTLLPPPLPPQALVCNATYVLTEFNRDNGSTAFLPGSHKLCRSPRPHEAKLGEGGNPDAIAVEAPAGSLIVWHGNTWHGAFNRRAPGLRVSLPVLMARPLHAHRGGPLSLRAQGGAGAQLGPFRLPSASGHLLRLQLRRERRGAQRPRRQARRCLSGGKRRRAVAGPAAVSLVRLMGRSPAQPQRIRTARPPAGPETTA